MSSIEVDAKVICIILTIAKAEEVIEQHRQILSQKPQYEPYAAFQRLDRSCKGYVTTNDLKLFLT